MRFSRRLSEACSRNMKGETTHRPNASAVKKRLVLPRSAAQVTIPRHAAAAAISTMRVMRVTTTVALLLRCRRIGVPRGRQ